MKSEDFTKSNLIFSLEDINHDITKVISLLNLNDKLPNFDINTGIFQVLADRDPSVDYFISMVNKILQFYLHTTVYDEKPGFCPKCESPDIEIHNTYTKSIQDITGIVELTIQRYQCKNCEVTFSLDQDNPLSFPECHISKCLSRLMTILYTGGCSLRYTADIIKSTTGVVVNHNTVREHVLKWGQKIRDDYSNDLTRKTVKSLQMDEQYFSIRSKDPQNNSIQVIVMLDPDKNQIVDIQVTKAKQVNELDVKMAINKLPSKPEKIITDGAMAYENVANDLEIEQIRCLQHKVRNIRKKKRNKKKIEQIVTKIIEQEFTYEKRAWKGYKRRVIEELTDLVKKKKIIKKTGLIEIAEVNKMMNTDLENKYSGKNGEIKNAICRAYIHRRQYCGNEVVERINLMNQRGYSFEEAMNEELTTGKLEGFNRISRNRERKALCWRSERMVEAIAYLNAELYNTKRGHGITETPFMAYNQLYIPNIGNKTREITIRSRKYSQQFTHQIKNLSVNNVISW